MGAPTDDGAKSAADKIATLGGPAVTVEPQPASKIAVPPLIAADTAKWAKVVKFAGLKAE